MDGVDIDERNRIMQLQEKHWPTSVHEQAAIKSRQKKDFIITTKKKKTK